MVFYLFQLGIKAPLPQSVAVPEGGHGFSQRIFHSVIPVGTAIISAESSDPSIYLLHLIDYPEAFLFRVAFAITPPIDRASFLLMLESTGRVSGLLCYKRESVFLAGDASELFEYQRDAIEISYMKASQSIYYEVFGRN